MESAAVWQLLALFLSCSTLKWVYVEYNPARNGSWWEVFFPTTISEWHYVETTNTCYYDNATTFNTLSPPFILWAPIYPGEVWVVSTTSRKTQFRTSPHPMDRGHCNGWKSWEMESSWYSMRDVHVHCTVVVNRLMLWNVSCLLFILFNLYSQVTKPREWSAGVLSVSSFGDAVVLFFGPTLLWHHPTRKHVRGAIF